VKAMLIATAFACGQCFAFQALADQKSDDVATLLKITGQNTSAVEVTVKHQVNLILQSFTNAHPDLTGAEVASMETKVASVASQFVAKMAAEMAEHYETTLTDEQLQAVIAFYGSADGQAYLAANKSLAQQNLDEVRQDFPVLLRNIVAILLATLKGHSAAPPQPGAG
jgi:hypothetical protein